MTTYRIQPEDQIRFWEKVNKTDGCWIWFRSLREGYGQFRIRKLDGTRTTAKANRVAWQIAYGPAPDDKIVEHRCRTRACVRPDHLRLATVKENQENRSGAQANNKSSGVRGVSWHKGSKKWVVHVKHHGRLLHVGLFDTIKEAEDAAIARRNELFTFNDADRNAA